MEKSSKTFIEGKHVSVYSNSTAPGIELSYLKQDRALRMQCLELAVQLKGNKGEASVESVCKAADQFYDYLTTE